MMAEEINDQVSRVLNSPHLDEWTSPIHHMLYSNRRVDEPSLHGHSIYTTLD